MSQVFSSGKIAPSGRFSSALLATQACPVIEIEIHEQHGDVWAPTGEKIFRPAMRCSPASDMRRPASYTGCTVINKSDNLPDEIIIYSDIGGGMDFFGGEPGATAKGVREMLGKVPAGKPIDLRVNSPGGDAFEGMAIYNVLAQDAKKNKRKITGYNDGLTASAATVVLMAADKIVAGQQSMFMIHRAWSFAIGSAGDLRDRATMLDKIDGQTIDLYHSRVSGTGIETSRQRITDLVDAETFMDAEEQVAEGFADEIFETRGKVAAYGPLRPWLHRVPETLRKQFSEPANISRDPPELDRAEAA